MKNKNLLSLSNIKAAAAMLVLLAAALVLCVVTDLQISSANAKRSDLVRYSSLLASSFSYSQNELSALVNTSDGEHYLNYSEATASDGDIAYSRKMIEKIGLTEKEQDILDVFDESYDEHISQANQSAVEAAVNNSDFEAAKSLVNTTDYTEYSTYCYTCLNELANAVYERMTDEISSLSTTKHICGGCALVLVIAFAVSILITSKNLKRSVLPQKSSGEIKPEETNEELSKE